MKVRRFAYALALPLVLTGSVYGKETNPVNDPEKWKHWSFQPVEMVPVPAGTFAKQESNAVDRFLLEKLTVEGLTFAEQATPESLFRRLTIDLTGLAPDPTDIAAFLTETSPNSLERWMDRWLASPAYGENAAQPWLDLVRFAESDGFEFDHERKQAWRYRDWVIQALNADLPYDVFVKQQLAGDELFPGDDDAAIATGFLLSGPDMVDINLADERRHQLLNEMTATTGAAMMGLTLECAQCHDHKTDPIGIADFYALRAVFANVIVAPTKSKQIGYRVHEQGNHPPEEHVILRGDFRRPGEAVKPAFPAVLNTACERINPPPAAAESSQRRAALANWLTSPNHPLTARVMVNRLWQQIFGKGLVRTPSDFGILGERPTHPELLDWLAYEFVRSDWSLKKTQRLLLGSHAYRQAATTTDTTRDPENKLLSHMPRRRLSGETFRDVLLQAAGRLNRQRGGPSVRPPLPEEVTSTLLKDQWNVSPNASDHVRRSIYLFLRRNLRYPFFEVFDKPDPNVSCAVRSVSTTAPQSLTLLNSTLVYELAETTAGRLLAEVRIEPSALVDAAFLRFFSRYPTQDERSLGRAFLRKNPNTQTSLTDFCLALINANEAITID